MMQITVTFDIITPAQIEKTIDYYNQCKPDDWNKLKKNEVAEGGFCIALKPEEITKQTSNINDNIKQVRWHRKGLVSWKYGKCFSDAETQLLYQALCSVFDNDCVKIQN
jgi:hypothetical protein